jgi:arylsulfatase A-like enzyme
MFSYINQEFETEHVNFGVKDNSDRRYLKVGWGNAWRDEKGDKTFRWAYGRQSQMEIYVSDISNKLVKMECMSFNPLDQPDQIGDVFLNGEFLKQIEFKQKGEYFFEIPSHALTYGMNLLTFYWKYPRASRTFGNKKVKRKFNVRFYDMVLTDQTETEMKDKRKEKISASKSEDVSFFSLPSGGILEYFFILPKNPVLKFKLFSREKTKNNSQVHVAVYNEKEGEIVRNYRTGDNDESIEYEIDLKKFSNQTVRIVFSSSINNEVDSIVSWMNPGIYSSSVPYKPAFWESGKEMRYDSVKDRSKKISRKANVFIYLVDTLRADHLSCYGYERKTSPFIDDFAKDGLLFENCFANASWTRPAVASLLTGLYPIKHRAENRKLSLDVTMLSEILDSHSFSTAYLTSNANVSENVNFSQGIDSYTMIYQKQEDGSDRYYSSELLNAEFFKWLEESAGTSEEPLFAYIHTMDPHGPYTPAEPFLKFERKDLEKGRKNLGFTDNLYSRRGSGELTDEDIEYAASLYDCEILHNDHYFGEFIDFLKKKSLYKDSIIVFIADHGEQFMEHGGLTHGTSIFNEEIHVPLIIKFPEGEFAGQRSDIYTSQVDVFSIILGYLGMDLPPEVDGIDLLPIIGKENLSRTILIKSYKDIEKNFVGLIESKNRMKHIADYRGIDLKNMVKYQIYDLQKDFKESKDLYKNRGPFHFRSIKFQIDYILEKLEKSAFRREGELDYNKLDPKIIEELKALGYIK